MNNEQRYTNTIRRKKRETQRNFERLNNEWNKEAFYLLLHFPYLLTHFTAALNDISYGSKHVLLNSRLDDIHLLSTRRQGLLYVLVGRADTLQQLGDSGLLVKFRLLYYSTHSATSFVSQNHEHGCMQVSYTIFNRSKLPIHAYVARDADGENVTCEGKEKTISSLLCMLIEIYRGGGGVMEEVFRFVCSL